MSKKIIGYKGFNKDMTCKGFQYEEGQTYEMSEKPNICNKGFHFCEYPLDCFSYYDPYKSEYHEVESLGDIDRDNDDTKISTNKIKIGAKIDIAGIVQASIDYTSKRAKKVKGSTTKKKHGASSATGYKGASSTENETAVAVAWGYEGRAKGILGSYIVCAEWKYNDDKYEWEFIQAKMAKVDGKKIKENKYYQLIDGKFVEVEE